MSFKDTQPNNLNPLYNASFQMLVDKSRDLTYHCTGVNIPSVSLQGAEQPTTFATINHPGDQIEFDPLVVNFIVDEDLTNWRDILQWMKHIGMAEGPLPDDISFEDLTSDITITSTTNTLQPNVRLVFKDCFPTNLSGWDFDSQSDTAQPITSTVTFTYTTYSAEKVDEQSPC